jgi:hypothetical protein
MKTQLFPPDAATTPTIDPIADGIARLRQQHRDNVTKYAAEFDAEATRAWEAAEAKRRTAFLKDYRDQNWFPPKYPYASLDRNAQFRVSISPAERISTLAAHGLWDECLYCFLSRNTTNHRAAVAEVKLWFQDLGMEVDGPAMILEDRGATTRSYVASSTDSTNTIVHAKGLSVQFAHAINDASMIEVRFDQVSWFTPEPFDESVY